MLTESEDKRKIDFKTALEALAEQKLRTIEIHVSVFSNVNFDRHFQQFHNL